jgi:membrane associated rhomboid family serine protease
MIGKIRRVLQAKISVDDLEKYLLTKRSPSYHSYILGGMLGTLVGYVLGYYSAPYTPLDPVSSGIAGALGGMMGVTLSIYDSHKVDKKMLERIRKYKSNKPE